MILKKINVFIMLVMAVLMAAGCAAAEAKPENTENGGRITETVWKNENGETVPGPEGYAIVRYTYKGKDVTEMYFDADGSPFMTEEGCYGKKKTLDGKGRVVELKYLSASGELTLNIRNFARMTAMYSSFGEPTVITYYGLNNKPVVVPTLGYASVLTEFSGKTMTARTYRDARSQPVDIPEGYAMVKQKLNNHFQVIRIRYEHANGSPAVGPDGWYRCIIDRDEDGRILSTKYYDINENLTDRGLPYAWEERTYPAADTVQITRFDINGNKVTDENGVATLVRIMQDEKVMRERFLDAEGQPTVNGIGVGTVVYAYDEKGRIEAVTYQDTEGVTASCSLGYAGYRDTLGENGAPVTRLLLGPDGLPAETRDGYCEIRYQYDVFGNLSRKEYYNSAGVLVKTE